MRQAQLLTILALAFFIGCKAPSLGDDEKSGPAVPALVQVETADITSGDVQDLLTVTGHCDAIRRSRIITPIAGKVVTLSVLEGDHVTAGQVIATIRTREDEALRAGQRASDNATPIEINRALELRAETSGIVASRSASAGEYVSENQELVTIIEPQSLVFEADIPVLELSKLHIGMSGNIALPTLGGRSVSATIQKIELQADSQSQTSRALMRFNGISEKDRDAIKLGMIATATFATGGRAHGLLVPKAALLRNDETNEYTIVIAGHDSLAHVTPVRLLGYRADDAAISGDGLHDGMHVITIGHYGLADSTRIFEAAAKR